MDDLFDSNEVDPASDFLAREAAALGSDAPSFNSQSNTHDFNESASQFPDLDAGEDFMSAPVVERKVSEVRITGQDNLEFENQFPELEETPLPTGNGFGMSAQSSYDLPKSSSMGASAMTEEESPAIKAWKIKQSEEIATREAVSKEKKEATIVKAQNDIDNFYKQYNEKKAKNIAANKEQEALLEGERVDALAQGTTWERICDLVDLKDSRSKTNSKSTKDLSRFREILLNLRKEKESPSSSY